MHPAMRSVLVSFLAPVSIAISSAIWVSASARADEAGDCCSDLETRVAELEATTTRKGNRQLSLTISGYINEAAMYWNDGFADDVYLVTNDTERSRINFVIEAKIAPKWTTGGILEIGVHANRQGQLDQFQPSSRPISLGPDVRYSNWWLKHEDLGMLTVGRLKMASFHIVHMMLTETWYFARAGIGPWLGADGRGFYLRKTDGTLTAGAHPLRWGDIDSHAPEASPGDGERATGITYKTPEVGGFELSGGYTGEGGADVALRFTGETREFEVAAGIGYGEYWREDVRRCAVLPDAPRDVRCQSLGMSATVMHKPTGLYVYGAYGQQRDLNRQPLFQADVAQTDTSYYLQAGIEREFIALGKTTIFAEYEHDSIGAGVDPKTGRILNTTELGPPGDPNFDRMAGSKIETWGLGIGQEVADAAAEFYVSGRLFKAEVTTSATGTSQGSIVTPIEDFLAVVGGAKVAF